MRSRLQENLQLKNIASWNYRDEVYVDNAYKDSCWIDILLFTMPQFQCRLCYGDIVRWKCTKKTASCLLFLIIYFLTHCYLHLQKFCPSPCYAIYGPEIDKYFKITFVYFSSKNGRSPHPTPPNHLAYCRQISTFTMKRQTNQSETTTVINGPIRWPVR